MSRSIKYAARFVVIVALVAMVSVLFAPSSSTNSPYLSALSNMAASATMAAPPCHNMHCGILRPNTCKPSTLFNCTIDKKTGACSSVAC